MRLLVERMYKPGMDLIARRSACACGTDDRFAMQVTNLCDLSSENDEVASVCWMGKGQHLAVGTAKGMVQIWDAQAGRRLRTMPGHSFRVGALASKTYMVASGSRDRKILLRDVRVRDPYVGVLQGHKQEVCAFTSFFSDWCPHAYQPLCRCAGLSGRRTTSG